MNNRPGTPLPWKSTCTTPATGAGRLVPGLVHDTPEKPAGYLRVARSSGTQTRCVRDMLYAERAANAYPMLVEALLDVLAVLPEDESHAVALRRLLRELGELT